MSAAEVVSKATAVHWRVDEEQRVGGYAVVTEDGRGVASATQRDAHSVYGAGITWTEARAHADLIAEAGTVHHETGKTPRQLADEVERLKQQADEARGLMSKHRGNATGLHMAMWGWAERYDAALAEQQQTAGEVKC